MKDYTKMVDQLRELKRMQEELAAEIESIEDAIKADMLSSGVDELRGVTYKVTWKEYRRATIDSKALKADLPDVASKYTKETAYKRFTIA